MTATKKNTAVARRAKSSAALPAPSERERAAIEAALARNRQRAHPVKIVVSSKDEGSFGIDPPHGDEGGWAGRITDSFATSSVTAAAKHVEHLIKLSMGVHPARPDSADAGLAFVAALNPQDAVEAALAVQMFGAHTNAIEMMVRANKAGTVDQALAYSNIANKFSRTFAVQMEALSKLRRGGEQVVRHIHVNVDNRGGQAVIAETVNAGGREGKNYDGQPHQPHLTATVSQSVLGHDPLGFGMPVPGDAQRPLPAPWWPVAGSAEGEPECVEARPAQRRGTRRAKGSAPADSGDETQRRGDRVTEG